jgi:hypothetical protein
MSKNGRRTALADVKRIKDVTGCNDSGEVTCDKIGQSQDRSQGAFAAERWQTLALPDSRQMPTCWLTHYHCLVDKIFKGAKAGELPVERPIKLDLSEGWGCFCAPLQRSREVHGREL